MAFHRGLHLLILGLTLLALPYLVDVGFIGDLTPTHFAQEHVDTEEVQGALPTLHVLQVGLLNDLPPSRSRDALLNVMGRLAVPWPTISPPLPLISAAITSRPPPQSLLR
jgi:hypothetical protein